MSKKGKNTGGKEVVHRLISSPRYTCLLLTPRVLIGHAHTGDHKHTHILDYQYLQEVQVHTLTAIIYIDYCTIMHGQA